MSPPPDGGDGGGRGSLSSRFRTAATLLTTPSARHEYAAGVEDEMEVTRRLLPVRYQRKDDDDGPYLTCVEASNITVRIERALRRIR